MSTSTVDQEPLRRAALRLHAMADADRQWVIEALDGGQRALLQPLLGELRALGIPREAVPVAALAEGAPTEPELAAGERWLDTLDTEGVAALASVLSREPPAVMQALLAAKPWPWRAPLVAAIRADSGAEIRTAPPAAAPAPRLQRELAAVLHPRWRAAMSARAAPTPRRWAWVQTMLTRLGRPT